jgi:hypothetical protein
MLDMIQYLPPLYIHFVPLYACGLYIVVWFAGPALVQCSTKDVISGWLVTLFRIDGEGAGDVTVPVDGGDGVVVGGGDGEALGREDTILGEVVMMVVVVEGADSCDMLREGIDICPVKRLFPLRVIDF